jgi:hypothetical protein
MIAAQLSQNSPIFLTIDVFLDFVECFTDRTDIFPL